MTVGDRAILSKDLIPLGNQLWVLEIDRRRLSTGDFPSRRSWNWENEKRNKYTKPENNS
jgi:hypothetical protein